MSDEIASSPCCDRARTEDYARSAQIPRTRPAAARRAFSCVTVLPGPNGGGWHCRRAGANTEILLAGHLRQSDGNEDELDRAGRPGDRPAEFLGRDRKGWRLVRVPLSG